MLLFVRRLVANTWNKDGRIRDVEDVLIAAANDPDTDDLVSMGDVNDDKDNNDDDSGEEGSVSHRNYCQHKPGHQGDFLGRSCQNC